VRKNTAKEEEVASSATFTRPLCSRPCCVCLPSPPASSSRAFRQDRQTAVRRPLAARNQTRRGEQVVLHFCLQLWPRQREITPGISGSSIFGLRLIRPSPSRPRGLRKIADALSGTAWIVLFGFLLAIPLMAMHLYARPSRAPRIAKTRTHGPDREPIDPPVLAPAEFSPWISPPTRSIAARFRRAARLAQFRRSTF